MEKTIQITLTELQALLKEQRDSIFKIVNNHNPHVSEWWNKLLEAILEAPTPDLSHLKEAPQLPDLKELRDRFYNECTDDKWLAEPGGDLSMKVVNLTPHNLFEWFKPYLQLPKEEEKEK